MNCLSSQDFTGTKSYFANQWTVKCPKLFEKEPVGNMSAIIWSDVHISKYQELRPSYIILKGLWKQRKNGFTVSLFHITVLYEKMAKATLSIKQCNTDSAVFA